MDKISQLSDDLLIKILSLVPTKDAVAMSVVAKRWMFLWTLVPRLLFDDYSEEDEDEDEENNERYLSQFVSGTLLLHKAAVLESFHLNIASECSASEIGFWVRIAVDRFVRDLKISFYYDRGAVRLPSRLFRCETIETLEFNRVIVLDVPSRFSFRSLKKLRLLSVKYSDEECSFRLTSNCPVLEDLVVETCEKNNVVTFTVNVPSLQSLSIGNSLRECGNGDDVFFVHSHSLKQLNIVEYFGELNLIGNLPKLIEANLQSVSRQAKVLRSFTFVKRLYICLGAEVMVNGDDVFFVHSHSLKQLNIVEYFGELNLIGNLPKLIEANLQSVSRQAKVLRSFTFVKRLYICLGAEARYPTGTVLFQLVRLELCTCEDNWTNMLVGVLQHSPKLQVLKLEQNQDHCVAVIRKVCWIQPERVPECLLYQLKTFEWRDYGGTKVEKEVAMYILKNARRLATATIYPDTVKLVRKHRMFEVLEIATRSSRACELTMG